MNKPSYRIPSMEEIAAIPWNGYNVISTFAGCGGSSLGYKLAGFKVLWANEFIPIAAETYRLNHPDTIVDERDIRQIQSEEVLEAIGLERGQLDIFDGSPPCDSFSTAGKREKSWNKVKDYLGTKQRTDDLFWEYARLVKEIQPKVFIAENVSGLVKGTAKGYFKEILQILKDCGYKVKAKLLDAQWLGVPQMRQRIIFIGIRNDIGIEHSYPKPLNYRYTVRDALPWIVKGRFGRKEWQDTDRPSPTVSRSLSYNPENINQGFELVEIETDIDGTSYGNEWIKMKQGTSSQKYFNLKRNSMDKPSFTILAVASIMHPTQKRRLSIVELKRICAFPDDFKFIGSYSQQWARLGLSVPPMMMYYIAKTVKEEILDGIKIPYSEVMANV